MGCIETLLPRDGADIEQGWSFAMDESIGARGPPLGWQSIAGSRVISAVPGALHSSRLRPGLLHQPPGAPPLHCDALTAEAPHLLVPLEGRDGASGVRQSTRSRLTWSMPK